jgi:thiol-disulfide isomerase/thioredoxin
MATYAKGFKKQSGEQILLKTIVGIIVTVVFIVLAVFVYDLLTVSASYDDYTEITKYNEVLTQKDATQTQLQDYIVYFYSDSCAACNDIKPEALKLVKDINADGNVVFFVDTAAVTEATPGDRDALLAAIDKSSIQTPMVIVVVNGVFYEYKLGTTDVLALLENVKLGTYTPFN